jgi:putative membrane protein
VNREPLDLDRRWLLRASLCFSLRAAVACAAGAGASVAMARVARAPAASSTLNRVDREFVRTALRIGRRDHAINRLALRRAASPRVRELARRLLADQARMLGDLRRIAASRGLAAAKAPADGPLPPRWQALKGAAFDREYATRVYRDTRESVVLFERESREGADLELKAFATRTLPLLRAHLKLVQQGEGGWRALAPVPAPRPVR